MPKYLSFFLLLFSFGAFAQDYNTVIRTHIAKYKSDFLTDANSPLKEADLTHLHFYPIDSTYRINAEVKILTGEKIFKMPTYDGTSKEFIRYAQLNFELQGKKFKLTLYKSIALAMNPAYKDLLFLPFTDETNTKETYGGGRYIDLQLSAIKDGKLEFDFNKAYNPYCAYSDGYRCPIPPEENDLPISIKAGEKLYSGAKKHK